MRHATAGTIVQITTLLEEIRSLGGLVEKKPGVFYRKSRAFLHFHEEADHVFANLRLAEPDFTRFPATTPNEQQRLIATIRDHLKI